MPRALRSRVETHVAPTPASSGLRLVIDQHLVDGSPHHRIDLSYVVAGRTYRAALDGIVPQDMQEALRALLEILLGNPACYQQMGFELEPDEVSPSEPATPATPATPTTPATPATPQ